jgi:hypothetical protein
MNKHCYDFKLREYDKIGLFDDFVDMTYIITSKDSIERNAKVEIELQKQIPTKKIYFVYNSTFKTCNKVLPDQTPAYDIKDANQNIMQHSLENGFNNILILENDFFYSDRFLDNSERIVIEIRDFFTSNAKTDKAFAFNLGPTVLLLYPNIFPTTLHSNIYKSIISFSNQAVIYNHKMQQEIIGEKKNILTRFFRDVDKNMDFYINMNFDVYFYKYPLIHQLLSETENQNQWSDYSIFNIIIKFFIDLLNINKSMEPGFTYIYNIAFFMSYLLFFLFFFFLIYLFSFFLKKKNKNK